MLKTTPFSCTVQFIDSTAHLQLHRFHRYTERRVVRSPQGVPVRPRRLPRRVRALPRHVARRVGGLQRRARQRARVPSGVLSGEDEAELRP